MAAYRSYRDKYSRAFATGLFRLASEDPVVPDLALGLPSWELPPPEGIRSISRGRTVVAVSPIAFARPGSWPYEDRALYERYLLQMTRVVSQLLERGYFVAIVCSALGGDQRVIAELLGCLTGKATETSTQRMHVPRIRTWKDLVASLRDVDFLIASRLHSAILGFVTRTPTIAISFDPKVDWVMEDLGQTDYLLHIRDFAAADVIQALKHIELHRRSVEKQVGLYRNKILSSLASQYDSLAELALASRRHRN